MSALGFDRTYASKLKGRHGVEFVKRTRGYSEREARAALTKIGVEPPIPAGTEAETSGGSFALPGTCSYDEVVAKGYSLSNAIKREKTISAEIANEEARERLKQLRKESYSAEQINEKMKRAGDAVLAILSTLPDIVAESLEPAERPEARKRASAWTAELRARMAAALRDA